MRICAVAHNMIYAGGRSVGRNITAVLPEVAPDHTYLMIVPEGRGYESHDGRDNVTVVPVPVMGTLRRGLFDVRSLRTIVSGFGPDCVWGLGNRALPRRVAPQAILFQNAHRLYSDAHAGPVGWRTLIERRVRNLATRCHLRDVDLVFCQTECVRRRIIDRYDYEGRTALCPNAVSLDVAAGGNAETPPPLRDGFDGFTAFSLSRYYPHKNLEGIVEMFARHRDRLHDVRVVLTISREQGAGARRLIERIAAEGLDRHLLAVGEVDQKELAGYFRSCGALLFPTLLESFSASYVEAMHFGCPILTSDLDFAHEVCGEAAVYCDPWDTEGMARALRRVADDADLRRRLAEAGKERLKVFPRSWNEVVRGAVDELEDLVARS
jgi:glycosyltransferase involved in cell wall biosynthesis